VQFRAAHFPLHGPGNTNHNFLLIVAVLV